MKACSACGCHVRGEGACPHCGAAGLGARTAAAILLSLAMGGSGCLVQAIYGDTVTVTDEDGDGWDFESGDCDDSDPDVHPEAVETPGDGVDSNCDEDDDT